jgi:isoleucyl-tRNA synthetase
MQQDYNNTINLPKTDFPMRAGLPKREPGFLENWEHADLYHELMKKNEGKPLFVLHDGPPYANGNLHMGHALNKILKDFILRSRNMMGYQAPYIPGWDTHGLPIERQAIKAYGMDRSKVSTAAPSVKSSHTIMSIPSVPSLSVWALSATGIVRT